MNQPHALAALPVRAPPLSAWRWDASAGLLTLVDAYGWPETFALLSLDDTSSAFELVSTGGEFFGESLTVLVDRDFALCSCPDGDRPCGHAVALMTLVRTRGNPFLLDPEGVSI